MNKKDIKFIEETLSIIISKPLRDITRSGSMIIIDFGELIEIDTFELSEDGRLARDENAKPIPVKKIRGQYCLTPLCSMRLSCGDEIIFASGDIFLPTDEQFLKDDFVWDTFDWHTYGNSIFEKLIAKHFVDDDFSDYIVKSIKISKFGDLAISFENNFVLEVFAETSKYSENWRFGEINSTESLIINGNGIDRERSS